MEADMSGFGLWLSVHLPLQTFSISENNFYDLCVSVNQLLSTSSAGSLWLKVSLKLQSKQAGLKLENHFRVHLAGTWFMESGFPGQPMLQGAEKLETAKTGCIFWHQLSEVMSHCIHIFYLREK